MSTQRERKRSPDTGAVMKTLRGYFVAGLATLFPVAITAYILVFIFRMADGFLGRLFGVSIPGLGLVVTLLIILGVGVLSAHFFGKLVFRTLDTILGRLPIVKQIYPAARQLATFLFSPESRAAFRRVVLIEYPRLGVYSIAFVTNEAQTSVLGAPTLLLTLLVPTPPSPFTGPIVFASEEGVTPLELSVEDAMKLIVSGGVVASPLQAGRRAPSR